jgi:hypothetical protein
MFFVAARIKDWYLSQKYGVVEWGWRDHLAKSQGGNRTFLEAIAMSYGGTYRDYFLYTTEDIDEHSVRAMAREDFMPIWEKNKIVGLEFIPGPPPPKLLSRYQILLRNTKHAHEHIPHKKTHQCCLCGAFIKDA